MYYFLPFYYGFKTRVKTLYYKMSFILTVFLPILFIAVQSEYDYQYILPRLIIAFVAMYSLYEIGYINNDIYTIHYESEPTIRLRDDEYVKVKRLSIIIISIRWVYILLAICFLMWLETNNLIAFLLMLASLEITYALHNYYRNSINIFTMFVLNVLKYCSVPILFFPFKEYVPYIIVVSLVIPLIRSFEKIKALEKVNFDKLRLNYYIVLTLFFLILYLFHNEFYFGLILSGYFLLFRLIGFLLLRTKSHGEKIKKIRSESSFKQKTDS